MKKILFIAFLFISLGAFAQTRTTSVDLRGASTKATKEGRIYYNDVDKKFYGYNGTVWVELGATGGGGGSGADWLTNLTNIPADIADGDDNTQLTDAQITALGFIKTYTETDPIYGASQAANITAQHITDLGNLSNTNTGDQTGATLPITPNGNLGATNAQAAFQELQTDIDNLTAGGGITWATPINSNLEPDTDDTYSLGATNKLSLIRSSSVSTDIAIFNSHFRLAPQASEPTGVGNGSIYYDQNTNKFKFREAGNWIEISTTGGTTQNASEVPFTANGSIEATDVQAAIQEVRDEAGTPYLVLAADGTDANADDTEIQSWLDDTSGKVKFPPAGVYYISQAHTVATMAKLKFRGNPNAEFRLHPSFNENGVTHVWNFSGVGDLEIDGLIAFGDLASNQTFTNYNNEAYFIYSNAANDIKITNSHFTDMPKAAIKIEGANSVEIHNNTAVDNWNYFVWTVNCQLVNMSNNIADGLGLTAQNTGNTLGDTPLVFSQNDEYHNVDGLWLTDGKNTGVKTEGTEFVNWNQVHTKNIGKDPIKGHELGTDYGQIFVLTNSSSEAMLGHTSTADSGGHVLVKDFPYTRIHNFKAKGGNMATGTPNEYGVFINNIDLATQGIIDIDGVQIDDVADAFFYGYNITGTIENFHGNNYNLDPSIVQGGYQIQLADHLKIINTSSTNTVKPTTGDGFGYSVRGTNITFKNNYSNNSKSVGVLASVTGDSDLWDFSNNTITNYSDYGIGGNTQAVSTIKNFKYNGNIVDGAVPLRFDTSSATIQNFSAVGNNISGASSNLLTLVGTGSISELGYGSTTSNGGISKTPSVAGSVTVTATTDFDAGGGSGDGVISNVSVAGNTMTFTGANGGFNGDVTLPSGGGSSLWTEPSAGNILYDGTSVEVLNATFEVGTTGTGTKLIADIPNDRLDTNFSDIRLTQGYGTASDVYVNIGRTSSAKHDIGIRKSGSSTMNYIQGGTNGAANDVFELDHNGLLSTTATIAEIDAKGNTAVPTVEWVNANAGGGTVNTGFHSVVDLAADASFAYSNQVSGTGYRVFNSVTVAGTRTMTLDNLRTGQVDENYIVDVDGSTSVLEIVPGTATIFGLDQGTNNRVRVNALGTISLVEKTDGNFRVECSNCEWFTFTTNKYIEGSLVNPDNEVAGNYGSFTDSGSGTGRFSLSTSTDGIMSQSIQYDALNTDAGGFRAIHVDLASVIQNYDETKNYQIQFWVENVSGSDIRVQVDNTDTSDGTVQLSNATDTGANYTYDFNGQAAPVFRLFAGYSQGSTTRTMRFTNFKVIEL